MKEVITSIGGNVNNVTLFVKIIRIVPFNSLSAIPTKWSNTLKQFVQTKHATCRRIIWVYLNILCGCHFKGWKPSKDGKIPLFVTLFLFLFLRRIQVRRQSARQESRKLSNWKEFQLGVAMVMLWTKFLLIYAM